MHLDDILSETAARAPHRTALSCAGRHYSYAALDAWVTRVASGFRNLGLVPGDRLAYQLRNDRPEVVVTLFAAWRAGLVVVPLAVRQAPVQLRYVLTHSDARALVIEPELLEKLSPEQRLGPEWIVTMGSDGAGRSFDALPCEPLRVFSPGFGADDAIGLIVYTSGTTSRPKGVAHSQRRMGYRVDLFVEEMNLSEADATVALHDVGRPAVLVGQVLSMFRCGGRVALVGATDPAAYWREYWAQSDISYVFMTAGMLTPVLSHPDARLGPHVALRYWLSGGDRVLPNAHALAREVLGKPIHEVLGMTEVGFIAMAPRDGDVRPGSVGRPLLGCRVRIVDDVGGEVPPGAVGELLVRTPNTMVGYWNDTIGTFRAFTDAWVRSGDLGTYDADGYLWIVGRAKLMISRGGFKVAPPMVEDAIREHPAIAEAVVVAQSHPVQNQVPFAFYQTRDEAPDPGAEGLRAWLQSRVDSMSIPETFAPIDRWPLTAEGKVDRPRLTWMAESGAYG